MGADSSNLTVGAMATVRDFIDGKLLSQIDNWHGDKAKIKTLKIQLYKYLEAMHPRMRELAEKKPQNFWSRMQWEEHFEASLSGK